MTGRKLILIGALAITAPLFSSCTQERPNAAGSKAVRGPASTAVASTVIVDAEAAEKLRGNQGITLQWISWDYRGELEVTQRGDVMHLQGEQRQQDGDGVVRLEGDVARIDTDNFILNGTLTITDTPDAGRNCKLEGPMTFGITQNRKYWRLRSFEWCDGLTDYVDIYF
ncbi:hypothetical protein ACFOWX_02020 [Sphingorhabdus arenilitoris]|uniref:Lipoprotein n=1 Tax=Sphingorhabdus arenilitoris TaxID=1490041 RepID=A0ABV8REQ5_9SPHN